ncbi:hypothetical protein TNCV_2064221 [Trichonephila clavipes]|nr:hypothetical protein TNCV_2064221 [Trichonephila clavipes]
MPGSCAWTQIVWPMPYNVPEWKTSEICHGTSSVAGAGFHARADLLVIFHICAMKFISWDLGGHKFAGIVFNVSKTNL